MEDKLTRLEDKFQELEQQFRVIKQILPNFETEHNIMRGIARRAEVRGNPRNVNITTAEQHVTDTKQDIHNLSLLLMKYTNILTQFDDIRKE